MSEAKKIAVITSYYINNYGSVLQAFATNELLSSIGLDVVFINYIRENVRNRNVINENWNKSLLKRCIYSVYKYVDEELKKRVFSGFTKTYLNFSESYESKTDLYERIVDADIYCVGSDQMWNSEYNGGVIGENFLDFVPNGKKKISFSTSIGMSSFSEEDKTIIKDYLSDFSFISVREKEAVDILKTLGLYDVHQFLDPTLLISGKKWKEWVKTNNKRKGYVLIYQLNDNPNIQEFAKKLARQQDLEIRQITYYMSQHYDGIKTIYIPKVEDFVALIANADYVVTDSFHGTAFSINLHKEFFSFDPGRYSGRINSVLALTGLENRFVNNYNDYILPNPIDFERVETILEDNRKEANALLMEAIK